MVVGLGVTSQGASQSCLTGHAADDGEVGRESAQELVLRDAPSNLENLYSVV